MSANKHIAITDFDFADTTIEQRLCDEAGIELSLHTGRDPESIIKGAQGADGTITSYGEYSREVFEALPQLKVVARTGTGYDTIDVDAASEYGVAVCTIPDYGTEVVSDHAIALALDVLRQITHLNNQLREGAWHYEDSRPLGQSYGRTFGVIGYGNIGRAVARKARGLGFDVQVYSRSLWPGAKTPEGFLSVGLNDLLANSDIVSLHVPLTQQTHHLINQDTLKIMKPSAILVNTARGGVVDADALAAALNQGKLWGAGIDVFETEPIPANHPLLSTPRTVLTPHTAYFSEESNLELRTRTCQAAIDVILGNTPRDILNPEVLDA